jgi:multidrug efflux pump subunit AcrA (membrane-fusion protein)
MNEPNESRQESDVTTNDSSSGAVGAAPSPVPPKGPRVRRIAAVIAVGVLLLWLGHAWGDALKRPLVKAWGAFSRGSEAQDATTGPDVQFYTCGMHPWVILPGPGDCPVCHMKLTPLDPAKFTGEITIDPVITQNIGVRVAPVVSGPLTRTIRTVGKVDYDETAVRDINTRVDGWMEGLYVDYVGARVEAGQPLFDVFSRELYSAQEEFLIALRSSRDDVQSVGFVPQVGKDLERNLEAARRRLLLFGITPDQIEKLEQEGEVSRTMTITSPYSGLVTEKHAFEGMRVTPGMLAYRLADLSKVWVFVTLYEYQLPFVQEGQAAVMTLAYIPGQRFEGKVAYVYPWLQEKTREVRVRLEFANPNLLLKPGMFTTVELKGLLSEDRTLAPREAIIDTGEREVAFVSRGAGKFEPREVRMGVQAEDGMVEILSGLRPGELVVTSGQFLLDSEAKIREALGKMIRGEIASERERGAAVAGSSELESLPEGVAADLMALLERYFDVGARLAADQLAGTAQPAREIGAAVDRLLGREIPGKPHFWHEHDEIARIRGKALELAGAQRLEDARLWFGDLSVALTELIGATGVPPGLGKDVRELHCPMYREGQGGSIWLQPAGDVRNPYFGSVMLECFDRERPLPATGQAAAGNDR